MVLGGAKGWERHEEVVWDERWRIELGTCLASGTFADVTWSYGIKTSLRYLATSFRRTWHDIVFFDWEKTASCKLELIEYCKEQQEKLREFLTLKWKRTPQYLRVVSASQRENLKIWLTNAYGKYEVLCALEDTPSLLLLCAPDVLRPAKNSFLGTTNIVTATLQLVNCRIYERHWEELVRQRTEQEAHTSTRHQLTINRSWHKIAKN
ncbi:hypothetical protein F5J12DRAFT_961830 [Pisolithus orientalis]|uniref:uncharacterized protein n=1 Tax=Pisolithus orientalis TaxID=936130 RepID=UPI0022250B85|nr:uncharacterized protein F5J12DRAFT_961830 [Pisolithus orientalis]KAI5995309.1 hypothetical protein F5J12DRAFT_961830 [Pisolithus orientalis]